MLLLKIGNVLSINPGGKIKTSKRDSKVRKKTNQMTILQYIGLHTLL
jgi:hypothetical protein